MKEMVLANLRLIDGTGTAPRQVAAMVIRDGRIAGIHNSLDGLSADERKGSIDLEGRTVVPGLINAHIHILMDAGPDSIPPLVRDGAPKAALKGALEGKAMLENGITTARDLGGYQYAELALRDIFASGAMPGPRLLCAGKLITMTGGHGWQIGFEADGADAVRKAARENLKMGVDCLKIMATGGVLTPGVEPGSSQLSLEEIKAGVEEAHKVGKRTASHAQGTQGVKNAILAGIDSIEHGIFLDEEAIEMMAQRGTVLVPTLAAPFRIVEAGEAAGIPSYAVEKSKRVMDAHIKSFEWAVAAGVTVAAGNDGGTPFNPSHDLLCEIRMMAENGLGNLGAIRAATLGSAKALGLSEETGTLQQGMWADLLALESGAEPLKEINDLGKAWMVVKQGRVVVDKSERGK
jgi:imidazolonepropionase-like amidohydrolase